MSSPAASVAKGSNPDNSQIPALPSVRRWNGYNVIGLTASSVVIVALGLTGAAIAGAFALYYTIEKISRYVTVNRLRILDAEKIVTKRFSKEFLDKVRAIHAFPHKQQNSLIRRLALSSDQEAAVFTHLQANYELSQEQLREILCGAFFYFSDGGKAFLEWRGGDDVKEASRRFSSHDGDGDQRSFQGKWVISEFLFGRIRMVDKDGNEEIRTWGQMERNPTAFGSYILHLKDYFVYRWTKRNQGPEGSSSHTELNDPLFLKPKPKHP